MISYFPAKNGPLQPVMTLCERKWLLRPETFYSWPEMTTKAVNVTLQSLSHAAMWSKTTAFC